MSRISLRLDQQTPVPLETPGQPIPQGYCLFRPTIYASGGQVENFNHTDQVDWIVHQSVFFIPNGVRTEQLKYGDDFYPLSLPVSDIQGTVLADSVGIRLEQHYSNYPFLVRWDLQDENLITVDGAIQHTPEFPDFQTEGLWQVPVQASGIGGTATNTISTRQRVEGTPRTQITWHTYSSVRNGSRDFSTRDLTSLGTDLSDQVVPLSVAKASNVLGPTTSRTLVSPGTTAVPPLAISLMAPVFQGGSYPSAGTHFTPQEMVNTATVKAIFTVRTRYVVTGIRVTVNPKSGRLEQVPGSGSIYAVRTFRWERTGTGPRIGYIEISQVKQVKVTSSVSFIPNTRTTTTNLYGKVDVYSSDTLVHSDTQQLPREADLFTMGVSVGPPQLLAPNRATKFGFSIDNGGFNGNWRYYDTSLPRYFRNTTQIGYQIFREDNTRDISLVVRGEPIPTPANTGVAIPEGDTTLVDSYLRFTEENWDGRWKDQYTRDPAWILLWVLKSDLFELNNRDEDLNLQSFYDASVYNNELINGAPRWAFDGELSGSYDNIINNLLSCMNAALYQGNDGKWTVVQERPDDAKWLIGPHNVTSNGGFVYRLPRQKPNTIATFFNRKTGQDDKTKQIDLTDVEAEYPAQDAVCAQRWASWQSFRDKNLLDTVEFTLPLVHYNNTEAVTNFYNLKLYDIIELYDPSVAGIRLSGRVTDAYGAAEIRLDYLPMELFAGGNLYTETNGVGWMNLDINPVTAQIQLGIQQQDGGIDFAPITRIRYNPSDLTENKVRLGRALSVRDGTTWALAIPSLKPRKYRVTSISRVNDGKTLALVAQSYYDGQHDAVEKDKELVVPNFVYSPACGTKIHQFQGLASEVHINYPRYIDSIRTSVDQWGSDKMDTIQGFVNLLDTSCKGKL